MHSAEAEFHSCTTSSSSSLSLPVLHLDADGLRGDGGVGDRDGGGSANTARQQNTHQCIQSV